MANRVWCPFRRRMIVKHNRNMASQQCARKRIIKQRGNKCEHCGFPGYVELHHIVEVKDGGTFANENLLLLCEVCHADAHGQKKKTFTDLRRKDWKPQ